MRASTFKAIATAAFAAMAASSARPRQISPRALHQGAAGDGRGLGYWTGFYIGGNVGYSWGAFEPT